MRKSRPGYCVVLNDEFDTTSPWSSDHGSLLRSLDFKEAEHFSPSIGRSAARGCTGRKLVEFAASGCLTGLGLFGHPCQAIDLVSKPTN